MNKKRKSDTELAQLLSQVSQRYEEAKQHLEGELLEWYALEPDSVDAQALNQIREHVESCERCKGQVEHLQKHADHLDSPHQGRSAERDSFVARALGLYEEWKKHST